MLLVAAFLRGATNPPPKDWFFKSKTWKKGGTELSLTVPAGARQIVLFLAPDDNSDYDAIVEAVRDRPGTFVRASQELNQARSDEHTSELQSLMRISYAVFCLKKKITRLNNDTITNT